MCGFVSHVFLIHYFCKEQFHWKYLLSRGLLEARPKSPRGSEADVPSICSVLTVAPKASELHFCCGKTSKCNSPKHAEGFCSLVVRGRDSNLKSVPGLASVTVQDGKTLVTPFIQVLRWCELSPYSSFPGVCVAVKVPAKHRVPVGLL